MIFRVNGTRWERAEISKVTFVFQTFIVLEVGDGPIVCDNNEHPPGRAPKPRRRSVYPPPGCWDADMHSTRLQSHISDMDRQ